MPLPPKSPAPKSLRFAFTVNLLFPGMGLFYLGRRWLGSFVAVAFLACFVSMLTIFLRGYRDYLGVTTGGDILQGENLEQLTNVFHARWLIGLLIAATLLYLVSFVGLTFARPQR